MANNDDLENNISSFTMEMTEMSYMVQNFTDKSLLLVDELGRGIKLAEKLYFPIEIINEAKQISIKLMDKPSIDLLDLISKTISFIEI
ncbi:hypothetical protein MXB_3128 [Myxobolus squamalis]|nr:hypothetical protein MXB_3128 [Myxobolus squamalis]